MRWRNDRPCDALGLVAAEIVARQSQIALERAHGARPFHRGLRLSGLIALPLPDAVGFGPQTQRFGPLLRQILPQALIEFAAAEPAVIGARAVEHVFAERPQSVEG